MNLAEEEISYMVSRFLLGHTRAPTTSLPTSLSIPGSPPACALDQRITKSLGLLGSSRQLHWTHARPLSPWVATDYSEPLD